MVRGSGKKPVVSRDFEGPTDVVCPFQENSSRSAEAVVISGVDPRCIIISYFSLHVRYSKDMSFYNGDRKPRKYALYLILCHSDLADQYCNLYNRSTDDINEEDEDEEKEESEEGSEKGESEEESGEEGKPELTRQERRDLKKREAAAKAKEGDEEEEDEFLVNPNHVQKKLTISDLNSPRELTRRERCVFPL